MTVADVDVLETKIDALAAQLTEHTRLDEERWDEMREDLKVIRRVLVEGNGVPSLTTQVARNTERIAALEPLVGKAVEAADAGRVDKKSKFSLAVAALALVGVIVQATCNSGCASVGEDVQASVPAREVQSVQRLIRDGEFYCTVWHVHGDTWATAGHCVAGMDGTTVFTVGGRTATSVTASTSHDVAVIHVGLDAPDLTLGPLPLFGEPVHYIGYSADHLGDYEGVYSGVDDVEDMHMYTGFTDGGASGSPLFDSHGRVIGVVVASYRGRPWSYFEPIQGLRDILSH